MGVSEKVEPHLGMGCYICSMKMIHMNRKLQKTPWFDAGSVDSTFLVKGNDYKFNIFFNNQEVVKSKMQKQNNIWKTKINLYGF